MHIFLLTVVLFIHADCFGVNCRVLKISAVEMLSLQYNGTRCHSACDPQRDKKTHLECLLPEIINKIIHRPHHEQFYVGPVFFPYHCAEGSQHLGSFAV